MSAARQTPVALVTGANRGIGLETCRQLLEKGLRVAMTGRDEASLRRAVKALGATGNEAIVDEPLAPISSGRLKYAERSCRRWPSGATAES